VAPWWLGADHTAPTYTYACTYQSIVLHLTLTRLRTRYGLSIQRKYFTGFYRRYSGDMAELGKGEILQWVPQMTSVETQVTSLRMNEAASEMADGMADRAEVFRTHSYRLPSGARVIDAGVEVDGGIEAGLAISEMPMGCGHGPRR